MSKFDGFVDGLQKTALGLGTLASYATRRAAQGVPTSVLSRAVGAAGSAGATTSRQVRGVTGLVGQAQESARGAAGAARFAAGGAVAGDVSKGRTLASAASARAPVAFPQVPALRQRMGQAWESAVTNQPGVRDVTKPLSSHYDYGATAMSGTATPQAYSASHLRSITGPAAPLTPSARAALTPPMVSPAVTPTLAGSGANPYAGTHVGPERTAISRPKRRQQQVTA